IATWQVSPSNGFLNDKWKGDYEGISRCNAVLSNLKQAKDMSSSQKAEAEAEARFLRGHYYFDLKKMFNMVPWISDSTQSYKVPNNKDIWPDIEADFKYAMDHLPATQSQVGRANKWAAAAYLAKAYMFEHKYSDAKTLYTNIIQNGETSNGLKYKLTPNYEDMFDPPKQNNSGSVFSIQMIAKAGTNNNWYSRRGDMLNFPYGGPFTCCGFFQPTQELVNSFRVDSTTGLPIISLSDPHAYDSNQNMVKNDMGITSDQHFTPDKGTVDPRLGWTVGRRGVPYLDWGPFPGQAWVRSQNYSGPYAPKKNIYWQKEKDTYYNANSWAPGTAINVNVIRFAGVLLDAAEADAQTGDLAAARQLVNRVRSRMKNNPQNWVSYKLNEPYAKAVVNSQSAMLNSGASSGDWVVRTDTKSTWVLIGSDPTKLSDWNEYKDPNYKIGLYPGPWTNKKLALMRIHFERKLELAMEGHRYFDLVRWGTAAEQMNYFYSYEGKITNDITGGHFTAPMNDYYPIPQNQIDITSVNGKPTLKQNPGYKK
ncbi:MAG TPA: RagB/SusD family nutrient uptake outer membrane protein, partial [Balneolales bacterium]|nr:RagB/SusD family nutrient uptake outer membrane protein [Balneolales bacterium]